MSPSYIVAIVLAIASGAVGVASALFGAGNAGFVVSAIGFVAAGVVASYGAKADAVARAAEAQASVIRSKSRSD